MPTPGIRGERGGGARSRAGRSPRQPPSPSGSTTRSCCQTRERQRARARQEAPPGSSSTRTRSSKSTGSERRRSRIQLRRSGRRPRRRRSSCRAARRHGHPQQRRSSPLMPARWIRRPRRLPPTGGPRTARRLSSEAPPPRSGSRGLRRGAGTRIPGSVRFASSRAGGRSAQRPGPGQIGALDARRSRTGRPDWRTSSIPGRVLGVPAPGGDQQDVSPSAVQTSGVIRSTPLRAPRTSRKPTRPRPAVVRRPPVRRSSPRSRWGATWT